MLEKTMEFWHQIGIGSLLNLTDPQSMEEAGEDAEGLTYEIIDRRSIIIEDSNDEEVVEYLVLDLKHEESLYHLVIIGSEEEFIIRLYYTPEGMTEGTRKDLMEDEQLWLFLAPESDTYLYSDLDLAECLETPEIDGEEFLFEQSGFEQTLCGVSHTDDSETAVQLTEYETEADTDNPFMVILEEGWLNQRGAIVPDGGYITIMVGCDISHEEITLL